MTRSQKGSFEWFIYVEAGLRLQLGWRMDRAGPSWSDGGALDEGRRKDVALGGRNRK